MGVGIIVLKFYENNFIKSIVEKGKVKKKQITDEITPKYMTLNHLFLSVVTTVEGQKC